MAWIAPPLLTALLIGIELGLALLVVVALKKWFVWWPETAFQWAYRPYVALPVSLATCVAMMSIPSAFLPIALGAPIGAALTLLLAPAIASPLIAFIAWQRDNNDLRQAAAHVRNRLAEREGSDIRVSADRYWRRYVIDASRAAKQARYQPPGL